MSKGDAWEEDVRHPKIKTKYICMTVVLPIIVSVFVLTGCGKLNHGDIQQPDQIVLSWTGDPTTTQTISWYGDTSYQGIVQCGGQEYQAKTTKVRKGEYYRYSAELTGLTSGKTYLYHVGDGETWSELHQFTTAKAGAFCFLYMGDIQYEVMDRDYKKWGILANLAYKNNPDAAFVLQGGDMVVNNGDLDEYGAVMTYGKTLFSSISFMPTPGNHETSITPYIYKKIFSLPSNGPTDIKEEVYSFDYGDCHIVALNSSLFLPKRVKAMGQEKWETMMKGVKTWLEKDLADSKKKWKIVVMHHPPYPVKEDIDIYGKIRDGWVPIFEKYGVDLVFCGHQHVYMRTKDINGITYIMARSGEKYSRYYEAGDPIPDYVEKLKEGNSYQVVSVKEESLSVTAYDAHGKVIDYWEKK